MIECGLKVTAIADLMKVKTTILFSIE
ncbi:uncharacterized protein METZ01_LOCUS414349 [marine metagenome]|uniref:Uncharacterized protein n=1 Tax=marine metagenome TaxID=408172 RepID=A0A382WSX0_9ZZZZ